MERISRLSQAKYEAAIRHVDQELLEYIKRSFLVYLKQFRIAKYPIVIIFFTYVYLCFPELRSKILSEELWSLLPFNFDPTTLKDITNGASKIVFSFKMANGNSYVLKVLKGTIGQTVENIKGNVQEESADYTTVSEWYRGQDIVHPTHFLIANSPFNNLPVAISIQEFIDGDNIDLFDILCDQAMIDYIAKIYPNLYYQIYIFALTTLQVYEIQRKTIDILGPKNIVVNVFDGCAKLKIVDAEGIKHYTNEGLIQGPDTIVAKKRLQLLRDFVTTYESQLEQMILEA
jgi:hypothetical protein